MNNVYYDVFVDGQFIFRSLAEHLPYFLKCFIDRIYCDYGFRAQRKIEIKEVKNND